MVNVIEGEAIPVLEDIVAEAPVRGTPSMVDHIREPGLLAVYDKYQSDYGSLPKSKRIAKLASHLKKAAKLKICLTREQNYNLGYLTTIYALERFWRPGGMFLEDTGFLDELGLQDANCMLAGAYKFSVKSSTITGTEAFSHMEECSFETVEAAQDFGERAKNCSIKNLVGTENGILGESESVTLGKISGRLGYFGTHSRKMKIGKIGQADGRDFGLSSKEMDIGSVAGGLSGFMNSAKKGSVRKMGRMASVVFPGAIDCHVGDVEYVGEYSFKGAKNCTVDSIQEVAFSFGEGSTELVVGKIGKAGENFGKDSSEMKIGSIQEVEGGCGRSSTLMRIEYIGKAGAQFGEDSGSMYVGKVESLPLYALGHNSVDLAIKRINRFSTVDVVHTQTKSMPLVNAKRFMVYSAPKNLTKEIDCQNGAIIKTSEGIFSELEAPVVLQRIEKFFGEKLYEDTMDYLNLGVEDV